MIGDSSYLFSDDERDYGEHEPIDNRYERDLEDAREDISQKLGKLEALEVIVEQILRKTPYIYGHSGSWCSYCFELEPTHRESCPWKLATDIRAIIQS